MTNCKLEHTKEQEHRDRMGVRFPKETCHRDESQCVTSLPRKESSEIKITCKQHFIHHFVVERNVTDEIPLAQSAGVRT